MGTHASPTDDTIRGGATADTVMVVAVSASVDFFHGRLTNLAEDQATLVTGRFESHELGFAVATADASFLGSGAVRTMPSAASQLETSI